MNSHLARNLFLLVLISGFTNGSAQSTEDVFGYIRPCFDLAEFISRSEFVKDYENAHTKLQPALKASGFLLSEDRSVAPDQKVYKSEDGTVRLEIYDNKDGNKLFDLWKKKMVEISQYKSDVRNQQGNSVFMTVKTTSNGLVGALFFTGRNLFLLTLQLPFAVPETFEELDASSKNIVIAQFKRLYPMLRVVASTYVTPSEFVFYKEPGTALTAQQRLYGFVQFWTEVKYNFAFFDQVPDLNWDRVLIDYLPLIEKDQPDNEYYRTLRKVCALLKDGHTNIYPPPSNDSGIDSPPVDLVNISGKVIVRNVSTDLAVVLPIGSEILSVEGKPVHQYMEENLYPYISSSTDHIRTDWAVRDLLDGPAGSSVQVVAKSWGGKEKTLTLMRTNSSDRIKKNDRWKLFTFKKLPDNVAYVALNSFGNNDIVKEFALRIDSINQCKALVIDLRGNGGGSSTNGYEILEHLTNKTFITSSWRTREHRPAFKAWGSFRASGYRNVSRVNPDELEEWDKKAIQYYKGEVWYDGGADTITPSPSKKKVTVPFVVLIGHNTASAAEDFLIALDDLAIGKTIGSKTFGSTGQPLMLELPGGASARICTKRDQYPDGRQFVGFGVKPEIYVENTVEDLIKGTDSTLKKGVETVLKKK